MNPPPEALREIAITQPAPSLSEALVSPRRRQRVNRPRAILYRSGLPRALERHDTPEGRAYLTHLRAVVEQLGLSMPLPAFLLPTLREVGLVMLDLRRLRCDLETLRARRGAGVRRQEERRLRSEIRKTRTQMMALERHLRGLAEQHGSGHDLARLLAGGAR
jgi:hypothetical protein